MRVIALGTLSGATGDRDKGDVFEVDAKLGADLVQRGLVTPTADVASAPDKAQKAKE